MTFEKTLPDPTVQDNPQDLDSWFNELTPDLDAWKRTHFYEISKPWRDLGYAVIPSNGPADKTPLEEKSWKQWCGPGRVPVPDDVWREWCLKYADHEGLLLGDSSTGGLPDLAFVDADHPSVFGWCVSTFAPTPMTVESGRKEGGRHHYYQVRPGVSVPQRAGQIGAPEHFQWAIGKDGRGRWKSPIDVKSSRSYVCVPGTLHKSGLVYTASAPLTRETILSLPVFDDALYERLARTCKPGRVAQNTGASTAKPSGTSPVKGKTSTYFRESKPGSSIIPGPGLLAGKTLSEAARQLGPGAKVECGCPFHPSVSGRSATLRVLRSGQWRLSCHVETTTFEPEAVKRPTIEEADDAEDALEPPSVEQTAARLLRDGRFGEVISIAVRADSDSPELLGTLREAMLGEQGEQAEADREADLTAAYEAKLKKKKDAAEALDPRVVEAAKKATGIAAELVGAIREKLRAEGLPEPKPGHECGVGLGMQHAVSGALAGHRAVCKGDSCELCGPIRIAQRIAAVLAMPVTGKDGRVTGDALGEREVWAYEVDAIDFETWKKRWRRQETSCPISAKQISSREDKAKIGHRDVGQGFAAFHRGQKVLAVSTLAIAGLEGDHLADRDAIRARVVEAGTASYRATQDDDFEVVVVGKISSSHGLSLDPARLVQVATASAWVSLGPVKISALKAEMEARQIEVKTEEEERDGEKRVTRVASTGFVPPTVAAEVARAASSRKERLTSEEVLALAPPEVDLDDVLDDLTYEAA